jgi:N-acetyl-alpha-D-glucosaminyl L-malate synthase BshA
LRSSDAVTAVSNFLKEETERLLDIDHPIEVIHNFFSPRSALRTRDEVRLELGVSDEVLLFHSSNLRSVKRIDLLLEAVARIRPRRAFKLLILAGEDFAPFESQVRRLNLAHCVIVRNKVTEIEDYLLAADLGVFTSEMESFGLSILEGMCFGCPSVAMRVGGIAEVIDDNVTGRLTPFGDVDAFAKAVEMLVDDHDCRIAFGQAAKRSAKERFSAETIVSKYEDLYRRICN